MSNKIENKVAQYENCMICNYLDYHKKTVTVDISGGIMIRGIVIDHSHKHIVIKEEVYKRIYVILVDRITCMTVDCGE